MQLTLSPFICLVRPGNAIIMAVGVIVGGLLVGATWVLEASMLAITALAAMCIGAGGNAINDIMDLPIDRINRPDRPLPQGDVSVSQARVVWILLSLIGFGLALWISTLHAILAGLAIGLLIAYSAWFKQQPLIGNVTVAILTALALLFGGLAVQETPGVLPAALIVGMAFAIATTLAREIIKDVEDMQGDAETGIRTLPIVAGVRTSVWLTIALLLVTLVGFPLVLAVGLPPLFLALSLPAACTVLVSIWTVMNLQDDPEDYRTHARRTSNWIKITMVCGLVALAFAGI